VAAGVGRRADAGGADPGCIRAREALLDYLRSCVVFEEDERGNISKKVAGYHQFRAVRKTRAKVLAALKPPAGINTTDEAGKGGVGVAYAGLRKVAHDADAGRGVDREPAMANPTIRHGNGPQRIWMINSSVPSRADGATSPGPRAGGKPGASSGVCWIARRVEVIFTTIFKFTRRTTASSAIGPTWW